MRRKPSVAGFFYPGDADSLRRTIAGMADPGREKKRAVSVVSPHAGYVYSGAVAGLVFSSVLIPETCVILGPSHRDTAVDLAVMKEGEWETPLGAVEIDTGLAELLLEQSSLLEEDTASHRDEHSLEVQVPFLQFFREDVRVVPVCVSYRVSYADLEEAGRALARAVRESGREVLLVASTDMSHYVSQKEAREKDFLAIEKILALDPRGLYDVVREENISMCGFKPTTAVLVASKELGARKAELILYRTSGDVTRNQREVVGYAGLRIS